MVTCRNRECPDDDGPRGYPFQKSQSRRPSSIKSRAGIFWSLKARPEFPQSFNGYSTAVDASQTR